MSRGDRNPAVLIECCTEGSVCMCVVETKMEDLPDHSLDRTDNHVAAAAMGQLLTLGTVFLCVKGQGHMGGGPDIR